MIERRRGGGTKGRILEEACKVFAEKGYRDATHAEICGRAEANAAAVNYYFTSKDNLYRAVFEHMTERVDRCHPLDGGLPETAPPERRLRALIHAHLSRIFYPGLMGDLHRIRMAEIFDPTGLLEDLLEERLDHDRKYTRKVLRDLLGPDAAERDVDWCEMSVVAQCFVGMPGPDGKGPRAIFGLVPAEVDHLAEHILRFSLAGIRAVRRNSNGSSRHGDTGIGKVQ